MTPDTDIRTDENGHSEDIWGQLVEDAGDGAVPCSLLTGVAGTGKTTQVQQRIAIDPQWALLTSTTGISAVNLGAITVNSALGYYDVDSLRDIHLNGRLDRKLREIREDGLENLLIEECSMLTAPALDILYKACEMAHLGLILVGDFCQLPPVKGQWAFEADCWPRFAAHTEKLTKVWRQDQEGFLRALTLARAGQGAASAQCLTEQGIRWHTAMNTEFDGTTIVPKNLTVDKYNYLALARVRGAKFSVTSRRWGKQRSEWGQRRVQKEDNKWVTQTQDWGIPPTAEYKIGAYVMILSNSPVSDGSFEYTNGDCGHIVDYDPKEEGIYIKLVRTGTTVYIGKIRRGVEDKERPVGFKGERSSTGLDYWGKTHRNSRGKYVLGQIEYYPIRLAYATTIHKSQSLSLDRIQLDFRDSFVKQPGMAYVAISRCRTLEGLRMVGQPEVWARHCNTDPRVRGYL
jgi:hypothetical protein